MDNLGLEDADRRLSFLKAMENLGGVVENVFQFVDPAYNPIGPPIQIPTPIIEEALRVFTGDNQET